MLGPVSQWVLDHVKHQLKQDGVIVWFDSEAAFTSLLDLIELPNCTVIPFRGSFYEQRWLAEPPFQKLNKANLAKGHTLLLYVPRPKEEATPLLEFTKAGRALELTLSSAARKALQSKVPMATLDDLLANKRPTLSDLDVLGTTDQPNVLKAIFGTAAEPEIVVRYLTESGWEAKIDERGALDDLIALCVTAFGLPSGKASSHGQLRDLLPRHLLLTELRQGPTPQPAALSTLPLPSEEQCACAVETLEIMRSREATREQYQSMARQAEQQLSPSTWDLPVEQLASIDTFPFIEQAALKEVQLLVTNKADLTSAATLVERCRKSFWVIADGGPRLAQWQAASLCVDLCAQAERVRKAIKSTGPISPEQAVLLYVSEPDGWWHLDATHRRLEAHVANMEEDFALERLLQEARYQFEQTLQAMAERFEAAIVTQGYQFAGLSLQTDTYATHVEPLLAKGERVAYFLVDSLRFEMGRELHDTLTVKEKQLHTSIATLPSITQIGMAALMPGAEKGVALVAEGGKLGLQVDGTVLVGSASRMTWLKSRAGGNWVEDIKLDSLISDSESKLKKGLEKKSLVVIRSQEIDAQGEEDNRSEARQAMSRVLKSLRRGIERLRKFGFTRVVIAADHGHLFAQEYGEDLKVEAPTGQKVEAHRRCWVGQHATPPKQALHFKASDLGLGGDLEVVFPRGLAIFKTQGGAEAYFHGGISLQEIVLPVLTLQLTPPGKAAGSPATDLELKLSKPKVTNRMYRVELLLTSLLDPERRVRVVAMKGDVEVGQAQDAIQGFDERTQEVTLQAQNPNNIYLSLTSDLEGEGELMIQVLDATTGLVLIQRSVPYELM